jgi:Xaa-Pro aminopeptidase
VAGAGAIAALLCLVGAAAPGALPAQETPRPDEGNPPEERFFDWTSLQFPAEEYAQRRQTLLTQLEGREGVVLIPSAHGLSHGDTFRQADDFLYFTGLELPGSALVLDLPTGRATLFVPERDFRFESADRRNDFPGRALKSDPALADVTGIEDIRAYDSLAVALAGWERLRVPVHVDAGRPGAIRQVVTALIPDWDPLLLSLYHLQATYPHLQIRNMYGPIAYLRMIKSPLEVEAIRRSLAATQSAIRTAALRVRPGVTERDLEAAFEGRCKEEGAQRIAFASIIKSGPNSLWPWRILASHYDRRNRAMAEGELVIFDVGCEVDYYVSDVGRTFPVSGRFTVQQRAALEMEVGVSDAIIGAIAPGRTLAELQDVGRAAIPESQRRYMQAGLFFGHHIGLSTGDPSLPDAPLRPGMVFTVEPWYYNHDTGISVFTEDVVLVTENGAEVLTSGLPRTPDELERMVGR